MASRKQPPPLRAQNSGYFGPVMFSPCHYFSPGSNSAHSSARSSKGSVRLLSPVTPNSTGAMVAPSPVLTPMGAFIPTDMRAGGAPLLLHPGAVHEVSKVVRSEKQSQKAIPKSAAVLHKQGHPYHTEALPMQGGVMGFPTQQFQVGQPMMMPMPMPQGMVQVTHPSYFPPPGAAAPQSHPGRS